VRFACYGASLVSADWNGAPAHFRGLLKALAERGHSILFAEPDSLNRQVRRDIDDPVWAEVLVYAPNERGMSRALARAAQVDVIVKFSCAGVLDEELERAVLAHRRPGQMTIFWDVDAPATLDRMENRKKDPLRALIPRFDAIFTHGGGNAVVRAYRRFGALLCVPINDAIDPATHHPVKPDPRFAADLAFLGSRLSDREARIEELFLKAAALLPARRFLLGGNGWHDKPMTANVAYAGPVHAHDHNAFNCTPRAVLNVSCESMARYGASSPTRIFEAAGAAACIISDAQPGIEEFLEPGKEILIAESGDAVVRTLEGLDEQKARLIGEAARRRVLFEHTYALRASQVESVLEGRMKFREAV
jgi:spore maturation protein CgeB